MRHGPPAGQRAGAELPDQIGQLAFCEVRIPRHHDELVERGKRGRRRGRRFDEHGRTDGAAPPRQFVRIRRVADVPFDGVTRCLERHTLVETALAGAVAGRAIASDDRRAGAQRREAISVLQKPHVSLDATATAAAPRP